MAGAGFKTFNTGDVLLASEVNTYLMQQTVMVFDDATARTSALGANVAEGMFSYLKDTNLTYRYDGSAWISDVGTTSPLTTKGDVWGYSTADARIPVGANGTVLTADSAEALGVKWAAAGAALTPYCEAVRSTGLNLTNATATELVFNSENFDSNGCFNTTTGRFTPTTAGKYFVVTNLMYDAGGIDRFHNAYNSIRKNGSNVRNLGFDDYDNYTLYTATVPNSAIVQCNGTTDYISCFYYSSITTGTMQILAGSSMIIFKVD